MKRIASIIYRLLTPYSLIKQLATMALVMIVCILLPLSLAEVAGIDYLSPAYGLIGSVGALAGLGLLVAIHQLYYWHIKNTRK